MTAILIVLWIVIFIQSRLHLTFLGVLLLVASISFAINKRKTDYISFSVFIFIIITIVSGKIKYCMEKSPCFVENYVDYFYRFETLIFLIVSLMIGVLAISFFKVKNK